MKFAVVVGAFELTTTVWAAGAGSVRADPVACIVISQALDVAGPGFAFEFTGASFCAPTCIVGAYACTLSVFFTFHVTRGTETSEITMTAVQAATVSIGTLCIAVGAGIFADNVTRRRFTRDVAVRSSGTSARAVGACLVFTADKSQTGDENKAYSESHRKIVYIYILNLTIRVTR